jgi:hypothetical protein
MYELVVHTDIYIYIYIYIYVKDMGVYIHTINTHLCIHFEKLLHTDNEMHACRKEVYNVCLLPFSHMSMISALMSCACGSAQL